MSQERLQVAARLIKSKQYANARLLLNDMPQDSTAQEWLQKLDQLDPQPTNLQELQEELIEAEAEAKIALQTAQSAKQEAKQARRRVQFSGAVLIFLGSLFGSLLGAAADFSDAVATVNQVRDYFKPRLCVVGSDTILGEGLGESTAWKNAFEAAQHVQVRISAVGSNNGLQLAAEGGCAHVLAMSDAMSAQQEESLAQADVEITCAAEIGYDVIVFITDINNPVRTLEDRSLERILRGTDTHWSTVSSNYTEPITIFARPGSGTTSHVLENFIRYQSTPQAPFPSPNYQACSSNEDCLNRTLNTPGSLYWVSAAWMETQPDEFLQVLNIAVNEQLTVDPRVAGFDLTRYPGVLVRPLFMYVLDGPQTDSEQLMLGQAFLEYVRGVEGQLILEESHFYTHFNRPGTAEVSLPSGFSRPGVSATRNICRA
jgi:ABC-type phosphate transport system substrate-binding protein